MPSGRGNFFAIDRRVWHRVCELGLNEAVVYAVLARGTGRDQKRTNWSILSVEKYTGISRGRARSALNSLIHAGFVEVLSGGSRPSYSLNDARTVASDDALTSEEKAVYDLVADGYNDVPSGSNVSEGWWMPNPLSAALSCVDKGMLRRVGGQNFEVAKETYSEGTDWLWLPNELVTGAANEVPPIERVRRLSDVNVLRLLVELYRSHTLADDGGIDWRLIRRPYEREKIGEHGRFNLWVFNEAPLVLSWTGILLRFRSLKAEGEDHAFWRIWESLERAGLVECVPHLMESASLDAEIIHPCPLDTGTSIEGLLGVSARSAAMALANDITTAKHGTQGGDLVAVPDEFPNVQMVGIYRLRYRPHTRATAAWFARESAWTEMAARYQRLEAQVCAGQKVTVFPTNVQHQR